MAFVSLVGDDADLIPHERPDERLPAKGDRILICGAPGSGKSVIETYLGGKLLDPNEPGCRQSRLIVVGENAANDRGNKFKRLMQACEKNKIPVNYYDSLEKCPTLASIDKSEDVIIIFVDCQGEDEKLQVKTIGKFFTGSRHTGEKGGSITVIADCWNWTKITTLARKAANVIVLMRGISERDQREVYETITPSISQTYFKYLYRTNCARMFGFTSVFRYWDEGPSGEIRFCFHCPLKLTEKESKERR